MTDDIVVLEEAIQVIERMSKCVDGINEPDFAEFKNCCSTLVDAIRGFSTLVDAIQEFKRTR
jgi:hypothetical protein